MEWLPIDERLPIYALDTEEYPPILICKDKTNVFWVIPEPDQNLGNPINYF